jgi:hypothetical protein
VISVAEIEGTHQLDRSGEDPAGDSVGRGVTVMLRDARLAHPRHDPAGLLSGDQSGDGAVQTPRQIRRGAQGTGQIEHPPNCIDSSVHVKWSLTGLVWARQHRQADFRGTPPRDAAEITGPR